MSPWQLVCLLDSLIVTNWFDLIRFEITSNSFTNRRSSRTDPKYDYFYNIRESTNYWTECRRYTYTESPSEDLRVQNDRMPSPTFRTRSKGFEPVFIGIRRDLIGHGSCSTSILRLFLLFLSDKSILPSFSYPTSATARGYIIRIRAGTNITPSTGSSEVGIRCSIRDGPSISTTTADTLFVYPPNTRFTNRSCRIVFKFEAVCFGRQYDDCASYIPNYSLKSAANIV